VAALRAALVRFSGAGPAIVVVLIFTGLINSWFLIGPENALSFARSPYGSALAIKIVLFGGMLLLAALNRYRLTPRLAAADARSAVAALRLSLAGETALAFLVLCAVALMGTLDPPVHSG
jgi:putative copper resistance protein D